MFHIYIYLDGGARYIRKRVRWLPGKQEVSRFLGASLGYGLHVEQSLHYRLHSQPDKLVHHPQCTDRILEIAVPHLHVLLYQTPLLRFHFPFHICKFKYHHQNQPEVWQNIE